VFWALTYLVLDLEYEQRFLKPSSTKLSLKWSNLSYFSPYPLEYSYIFRLLHCAETHPVWILANYAISLHRDIDIMTVVLPLITSFSRCWSETEAATYRRGYTSNMMVFLGLPTRHCPQESTFAWDQGMESNKQYIGTRRLAASMRLCCVLLIGTSLFWCKHVARILSRYLGHWPCYAPALEDIPTLAGRCDLIRMGLACRLM